MVSFKVGDLTWVKKVAVAPTDMPDAEEVIYVFDLSSSFHSQLHAIYASREVVIKVNQVKTRSMAKKNEAEKRQVAADLAVEQPVPKSISSYAVTSTTDVNSGPAHHLQPQQLPKKNGQPTPSVKVSNSSDTANVSVKSVENEKEEAVMFGSLVDSMDFSVDQMR